MSKRKFLLDAWLMSFFLMLLFTPGFNSFETPSSETLYSFISTGQLSLDDPPAEPYVRGLNGRFYTMHELGTTLASLPFAILAYGVHRTTGVHFKYIFEFIMGFVGAGLFATTYILLLQAVLDLELWSRGLALRLLLLLMSSQYFLYGGYPADVSWSAPLLTALFLTWRRANACHRPSLSWLLVGIAFGLLVFIKLTNLVFAPILLLLILINNKNPVFDKLKFVTMFALGSVPPLLLTGWWNYIRTGSPVADPYPVAHSFVIDRLPEGLLGTLISPNKGLLLYTPSLVLVWTAFGKEGFFRRYRSEGWFILGSLGFAIVRIAGTAGWTSWGGWGIRYYVPWIPLLVLALATQWSKFGKYIKFTFYFLISFGILVNVSGLVTNFHYRQSLCGFEPWTLRGMNVCAVSALPSNLARAFGAHLQEAVVKGASTRNVWISNRLALWWYALQTQGLSPMVSWAICGGLLSMMLIFFKRIIKNTRRSTEKQ